LNCREQTLPVCIHNPEQEVLLTARVNFDVEVVKGRVRR
jgi:hypothetical protein